MNKNQSNSFIRLKRKQWWEKERQWSVWLLFIAMIHSAQSVVLELFKLIYWRLVKMPVAGLHPKIQIQGI
jgi:hypothetical protein